MKRNTSIIIGGFIVVVLLCININNTTTMNLDSAIELIKKSYVSGGGKTPNIDQRYIENLEKIKNKSAEEHFILAYTNKEEKSFDIAYEKMNFYTNKFVKYYLYNRMAEKSIEIDEISQAKSYTEKALNNVSLNRDNKAYYFICKSLSVYVNTEDGMEYMLEEANSYIEGSRIEENTYKLRMYIIPFLNILGRNEKALENIFQVAYSAYSVGDSYTQVRTMNELANILIDIDGEERAKQILQRAIEVSKNIENDYRRTSMQLYIYIIQCRIYIMCNEFEKLKSNVELIYDEKGKIEEEYNDILILAKAYESMYMSNSGNLSKAQELLEESKELLKEDKKTIISDKEVIIQIAEIHLEYSRKNYENAINICNKVVGELDTREYSKYEVIIMKTLELLYILTDNDNELFKTRKELMDIQHQISNTIAMSYIESNFNKYENIKSINERHESDIKTFIIICIQFLILILVIYEYKKKKQKNEILEKDVEILNNQFKHQFNHYESVKKHQEKVKLLWHDMKNHLNIINSLSREKKYEEMNMYLNELDVYVTNAEMKTITKNKVVDAMLLNKIQICKVKEIRFDIDVRLAENLGVQDIDMCIILGNLIDNAIEACEDIKDANIEKYINLICGVKNNYIYIKIDNSKENKITKYKNRIITNKKNKSNHGLGLKSINKAIDKYKGTIKISYDNIMFSVHIMIKREKN